MPSSARWSFRQVRTRTHKKQRTLPNRKGAFFYQSRLPYGSSLPWASVIVSILAVPVQALTGHEQGGAFCRISLEIYIYILEWFYHPVAQQRNQEGSYECCPDHPAADGAAAHRRGSGVGDLYVKPDHSGNKGADQSSNAKKANG